jgi:L-cysteine S-thiosulfotransferase
VRTSRKLTIAAALGTVLFAVARAGVVEAPISKNELRNGSAFTSAANRSQQEDDFANPGMLWVERGERLWKAPPSETSKSCQGCHGDASSSMKGVATRYPKVDPGAARLVDLSGRVNICRERHQRLEPLAAESESLLGLTAYVTFQSRGMPMDVRLDIHNARDFERGRDRYYRRMGQMNLSCAQCHDRNWGRTLLHETISQGHGTGFPAYRQEWQSVGSLQRRIRACYSGLRAEMPPYEARELLELELFLAWRANGLAIEAPGVRR